MKLDATDFLIDKVPLPIQFSDTSMYESGTTQEGRGLFYATPEAAAADIEADENTIIYFGKRKVIHTGISVALPIGYTALVLPRSGLSKNGIDVKTGVIDSDYRGEIKVCIENNSETPFVVTRGMRIAQLMIQSYTKAIFREVDDITQVRPESNRQGGFGSTGV